MIPPTFVLCGGGVGLILLLLAVLLLLRGYELGATIVIWVADVCLFVTIILSFGVLFGRGATP